MVKKEQEQSGSSTAPANPTDLNKAIIEHDQNAAMGQPSSASGLQERLLDPRMILLISAAIVGLGLLCVFPWTYNRFYKICL